MIQSLWLIKYKLTDYKNIDDAEEGVGTILEENDRIKLPEMLRKIVSILYEVIRSVYEEECINGILGYIKTINYNS